MCKESDHEFRSLSHLLASLPDPSLSQGQIEAVPVMVTRERGAIPETSNETLQAFSFSEMKLYKHAIAYQWTADWAKEWTTTIKLIKSTDFMVEDFNVDLHKRVAAAIAQGHFTSHTMRESESDGDQVTKTLLSGFALWRKCWERYSVLSTWLAISITRLKCWSTWKGNTNLGFKRWLSFQIAQQRSGPDCVTVPRVIYFDGSFIKHWIPVKPICGMYFNIICHTPSLCVSYIQHNTWILYDEHMSFIILLYVMNMIVLRMVYDMYMTFLSARSCQPQQRPDCGRQIICMAPAGNDAFYFKRCYRFTD